MRSSYRPIKPFIRPPETFKTEADTKRTPPMRIKRFPAFKANLNQFGIVAGNTHGLLVSSIFGGKQIEQ